MVWEWMGEVCVLSAEEAQLLVNYQLRVLKLVEAFVKRQSSSPWLVDLIVPLVRLSYRSETVLSA